MINFKFSKAIGDVHIPLCYRRYFVYVMEPKKKKKDDVPANGQHQSTNFSKFGTSHITAHGFRMNWMSKTGTPSWEGP